MFAVPAIVKVIVTADQQLLEDELVGDVKQGLDRQHEWHEVHVLLKGEHQLGCTVTHKVQNVGLKHSMLTHAEKQLKYNIQC